MNIRQKLIKLSKLGCSFLQLQESVKNIDLKIFYSDLDILTSDAMSNDEIIGDLSDMLALLIIEDQYLYERSIYKSSRKNEDFKDFILNGNSDILVKKFHYLMKCLGSNNLSVADRASVLLLKINSWSFNILDIEYLKSCESSSNFLVRYTVSMILLVSMRNFDLKGLINHYSFLIRCADSLAINVSDESKSLLLKIQADNLGVAEQEIIFDHIISSRATQFKRCLLCKLVESWGDDKLIKVLEFLLSKESYLSECCRDGKIEWQMKKTESEFSVKTASKIRKIVSRIPASDLATKLDFLVACINSGNETIRDISSKLALKAMKNEEVGFLVEYIDFLTDSRITRDAYYFNIAIDSAISVMENWSVKKLETKREYLNNAYKFNPDNRRTRHTLGLLVEKLPKVKTMACKITEILTSE